MAREITIPAQTICEDIRSLEEFPSERLVRVLVGRLDSVGNWAIPQQFLCFSVEGDQYDELCGPAPEWAPDKPVGTYRNDDLWHFIDLQRNA
jgi:hypothetical protein